MVTPHKRPMNSLNTMKKRMTIDATNLHVMKDEVNALQQLFVDPMPSLWAWCTAVDTKLERINALYWGGMRAEPDVWTAMQRARREEEDKQ